ncbi:hypothetical protein FHX08_001105 [Rhizobium sp. BK529]|uniref:cold-shock protein n=1 Tax=unclassified Rhizobium TaxID=2613769 RepID=UPI001053BD32|nr:MULTISPECIES: cold-shock protein [unclassified Rhizobium]MBB3590761.1 hypothetical protein [Rhizobium sp. BK529]TCS09282.1 hypothetical protein EV281_1011163 [Rhizobium sp. BK418]
MTYRRYGPGDTVVLKHGVLGSAQPSGSGKVLSILPAAQGFVHYRVRFQSENFERSIRQDDIDGLASPSSSPPSQARAAPESSTSSWINSNSIRTRK